MSLRVIWQYMDRHVNQKYYMDLKSFGQYNIFFGDEPVHILPYDPQCHELFAIYQTFCSDENKMFIPIRDKGDHL